MSEVSNRRFVHFDGTKQEFIDGNYDDKYQESIVFINGDGNESNNTIYTHGEYYGQGVIVEGDASNSAVLKGEYEGYSNKAISQVSVAIGAASTTGLKGWYYTHVNIDKKQIFLGTERTKILGFDSLTCTTTLIYPDSKYTDSSFVSGYEVGDVLSIVYNSKYEDYATITAISGNVITLDKIPFTSSDFSAGACTKVSAVGQPDEFSVYCIKRQLNDSTKILTVSKHNVGGVDFGGGALSEGVQTYAVNIGTHAEGGQTVAKGQYSHAEGIRTQASYAAHAEGDNTVAIGERSHTEGNRSISYGNNSHAEGSASKSYDDLTDSERKNIDTTWETNKNINVAYGESSHTEGKDNLAKGNFSHAEGNLNCAKGSGSHAEGYKTSAIGTASHAEGRETTANYNFSHAEGYKSITYGNGSHAEGSGTKSYYDLTNNERNSLFTTWETNKNINVAYGESSHTEGKDNLAKGDFSHAEGNITHASGTSSHTEGEETSAIGSRAHAEGLNSIAIGDNSHVECFGGIAYGSNSHAEGSASKLYKNLTEEERKSLDTTWETNKNINVAYGNSSHVEGKDNLAKGSFSHAEGNVTYASGSASHAEGYKTTAIGTASHAEGRETTAGSNFSHAEGKSNIAYTQSSHAEGENNYVGDDTTRTTPSSIVTTYGYAAHVEGQANIAYGNSSHAEGLQTKSCNEATHSEGKGTTAKGARSHAEGLNSIAIGDNSHAESFNSIASGNNSHAEGSASKSYNDLTEDERNSLVTTWETNRNGNVKNINAACGNSSHVEGKDNLAKGDFSHAEGNLNYATGAGSHAEGYKTTATGTASHAEGRETTAGSNFSHAEGKGSSAYGEAAHASGLYTMTSNQAEFACGKYNFTTTNTVFSVGNGTADNRKNIIEVRDNDVWFWWEEKGGYVKMSELLKKNSLNVYDKYGNIISTFDDPSYFINTGSVEYRDGCVLVVETTEGTFYFCYKDNTSIRYNLEFSSFDVICTNNTITMSPFYSDTWDALTTNIYWEDVYELNAYELKNSHSIFKSNWSNILIDTKIIGNDYNDDVNFNYCYYPVNGENIFIFIDNFDPWGKHIALIPSKGYIEHEYPYPGVRASCICLDNIHYIPCISRNCINFENIRIANYVGDEDYGYDEAWARYADPEEYSLVISNIDDLYDIWIDHNTAYNTAKYVKLNEVTTSNKLYACCAFPTNNKTQMTVTVNYMYYSNGSDKFGTFTQSYTIEYSTYNEHLNTFYFNKSNTYANCSFSFDLLFYYEYAFCLYISKINGYASGGYIGDITVTFS